MTLILWRAPVPSLTTSSPCRGFPSCDWLANPHTSPDLIRGHSMGRRTVVHAPYRLGFTKPRKCLCHHLLPRWSPSHGSISRLRVIEEQIHLSRGGYISVTRSPQACSADCAISYARSHRTPITYAKPATLSRGFADFRSLHLR